MLIFLNTLLVTAIIAYNSFLGVSNKYFKCQSGKLVVQHLIKFVDELLEAKPGNL